MGSDLYMGGAGRDITIAELQARVDRLERERTNDLTTIIALRNALRPFARLVYDMGDEWHDVCVAARKAMGIPSLES